jgi:hypothetical protein
LRVPAIGHRATVEFLTVEDEHAFDGLPLAE